MTKKLYLMALVVDEKQLKKMESNLQGYVLTAEVGGLDTDEQLDIVCRKVNKLSMAWKRTLVGDPQFGNRKINYEESNRRSYDLKI